VSTASASRLLLGAQPPATATTLRLIRTRTRRPLVCRAFEYCKGLTVPGSEGVA
jgi:hypothetical protein